MRYNNKRAAVPPDFPSSADLSQATLLAKAQNWAGETLYITDIGLDTVAAYDSAGMPVVAALDEINWTTYRIWTPSVNDYMSVPDYAPRSIKEYPMQDNLNRVLRAMQQRPAQAQAIARRFVRGLSIRFDETSFAMTTGITKASVFQDWSSPDPYDPSGPVVYDQFAQESTGDELARRLTNWYIGGLDSTTAAQANLARDLIEGWAREFISTRSNRTRPSEL